MNRGTGWIAQGTFLFIAVLLSGGGTLAAQLLPTQDGQATCEKTSVTASVPASPFIRGGERLIRFNGRALDEAGHPLTGVTGVSFAIYEEQSGGAALWQETQNLTTDTSGRFSALLGSGSREGVPGELFRGGDARWLAVLAHSPGVSEQPRVLLVSVPYAMQAANAETLGGLPASAFLRGDSAQLAQAAGYIHGSAVAAAPNSISTAVVAGGATPGYLPAFTDSLGSMSNSALFQSGTFLGVGTVTPATVLNLVGTNPTLRVDNYSNAAGDSPNFNYFTARGTANSPSATLGGDNLGQFAAAGYTGSGFPGSKVKVTFVATEDWTPTANGTAMSFQTTANGTTARIERLRINDSGFVGIGTANPTAPLTVAGSIQSTAGGFVFPDGSVMTSAATMAGLQPGGNLVLGAGNGIVGNGNLELQTAGVAPNTMSDRLLIAGKPKSMTGVVPTANLFSIHIPAGEGAGGKVKFTIVASDGVHYAMETGEIIYLSSPSQMNCAVVYSQYSNAPPSYTNTALSIPPVGQIGWLKAQCMPTTFGGDPGVQIFDTAPTAFTATTHKVYYTIENQSEATLTLQP